MQTRLLFGLAISLAVSTWIGAGAEPQIVLGGLPEPARVLSGTDVGFRLEGFDKAGRPIGTFVIRVNDRWVDVPVVTPAAPR